MRYQSIEQYITQFPIYQYEIIDSSEIKFDNKMRNFCKKECSRYGTSWSCQPVIGSIDKSKARCLAFPKALIFSSIADMPVDPSSEQLLKARRGHGQIVKQITKFLKVNNVPHYALATDECTFCERCTYPKKACLRPEVMLPCIESHGIVLMDLMERYEMDYVMEDGIKIWFGIIFLEEE